MTGVLNTLDTLPGKQLALAIVSTVSPMRPAQDALQSFSALCAVPEQIRTYAQIWESGGYSSGRGMVGSGRRGMHAP